jgi:membrane dipeptidase
VESLALGHLTDAQILALAAQGGIQGITFVRDFLAGSENIQRVVDHMIYHLDLVGDDRHLGLGSDFDGVDHPVEGLEDVTHLMSLADAMSIRGLSDDTVRRIFGVNYIEFFRRAWIAN